MWKELILWGSAGLLLAAGAGFAYLVLRHPETAPASGLKIESTPARLARGKHIFEHVADCEGCHSQRDYTRLGGPPLPSMRGAGQEFPDELGLPGHIVARNITLDKETGIGNWTDGEIIRAVREGVSRDGSTMFPFMPYEYYRHMSDEDVHSLVAYLRALPPVNHRVPRSSVRFPVNLLMKSAPKPVGSMPEPDKSDKLKYGEYLVTLGTCVVCHTKLVDGNPTEGLHFAGGEEFFIGKFDQYKEYFEKGSPVVGRAYFTLMPWLQLSQLPREELSAIYAYLRAQPAIVNKVETHPEK